MEEFIGVIRIFGGNFAPRGWAFCNGQLLPISQYDAVFSLLGTIYGGDGIQTFALPNLSARTPIHAGNSQGPGLSSFAEGQTGGVENVTLIQPQLPAHTHTLAANTSNATVHKPANTLYPAAPADVNGDSVNGYTGTTANKALSPNALSVTGASQPHENRDPYLAMNFIICLEGIYPSRN